MALRKLLSESTLCTKGLFGSCAATSFQSSTSFSAARSRAYATVQDGLKYAESHEWLKVEGDTATIGISDFAQSELGDVVYVELPEVGSSLEKSEVFGVVESVKTASDVYMPVGGEIVDVNSSLADKPDKVNAGAYTDGWLIKVKMSNASDADSLLDSSAYAKHIEA